MKSIVSCDEINYTRSFEDTVSGNITLCGKPKPDITWYIGDNVIDDARSESTT